MVLFKSCPRCFGDQATKRDQYGEYTICLSCGHTIDLETEPVTERPAGGRPEDEPHLQVLLDRLHQLSLKALWNRK